MRTTHGLILAAALALAGHFSQAADRYSEQTLPSKYLGERTVRVYLPPSYFSETQRRYPVLYLHDGQNVYSFAGTNVAFGWGSWELDKTADQLSGEGRMREVIMVAVDNSRARYAEYCGTHHEGTNALTAFENYSAFLIRELKPWVDGKYRSLPDAPNTAVMGSSMGGICSLILGWEHPEVFGKVASLSGAFMVERTNFLDTVLRAYSGKPKPVRVYLDCGTRDFMGGDDGRALTDRVAGELRRIGWGTELLHFVEEKPLTQPEIEKTGLRQDKWAEAQTSQHNEFYWRQRAWRPLTFLFPPAAAK